MHDQAHPHVLSLCSMPTTLPCNPRAFCARGASVLGLRFERKRRAPGCVLGDGRVAATDHWVCVLGDGLVAATDHWGCVLGDG